jgi:hypothetical protein
MRLLLMLPNKETEKLVSCRFLRQVLRQTWFLWSGVGLLKDLRRLLTRPLLVFVVEVCAPCADKSASPRRGDLQPEQSGCREATGCAQGAAQGVGDRQV